MSDSGDSSRRSRKSKSDTNKSRRSTRARSRSEQESRDRLSQETPQLSNSQDLHGRTTLNSSGAAGSSNVRGDVCQIGDSSSDAHSRQGRQNFLSWLLSGRFRQTSKASKASNLKASRSPSSSRLTQTRLEQRSLTARPSGQSGLGRDRLERSPASPSTSAEMPSRLRGRTRGGQHPFSSRLQDGVEPVTDRRLRSRSSFGTERPSAANSSSASSRLRGVTADTSRNKSDSRSPIPFSRRGSQPETPSRRERSSRVSETRLQSRQPTFLQQPTSLQSPTTLQDSGDSTDHPAAGRRSQPIRSGPPRPRSRSVAIALYAARMLILSIGVGVLAGTVLAAWNPAKNPLLADSAQQTIKQASSVPQKESSKTSANPIQLAQEMTALKSSIQTLVQQYPGFTPTVFLVDLDNNHYVDLNGAASFPAASTIKLQILIAFFQDVDVGKIRLTDKLTMRQELIAQGSGDMQYLQPGSQFTALETATKMITVSDNTATNMLIERLGGISALNQRFSSWGLTTTLLNSMLPDLEGTNVTSTKELSELMVRVSQGELVSLKARDRILDIMRRTVNNSQLSQGLGEGATIAHKTGDIGKLIGDVGLIDMPSGKRYAAAILVKRSFNDDRAYDLISKISRTIYQHLSGTTGAHNPSAPVPLSAPDLQTPSLDSDPEPTIDTDAQRSPSNPPITPERAPTQSNPMQASNR